MNLRTDFADELVTKNSKEYKKKTKIYKGINLTTIDILKDNNKFDKQKGKYISLEFKNLYDNNERENISKLLIDALKQLHNIKKEDKVLIVGLGNEKIISDSLGPNVADKIMVTNHLFKVIPEEIDNNVKKVCVFTPKVMGQTGLESADIVIAVNKIFKADLVIVIDALASLSISRVNKVIQLSDTGIAPGSGVGNYRKEITEKSLNCKVIAIGVATVVHANNILKEIDNNIKINDDNYDLILTPKDIDEDIFHLSTIIATSINKYIHQDYKFL